MNDTTQLEVERDSEITTEQKPALLIIPFRVSGGIKDRESERMHGEVHTQKIRIGEKFLEFQNNVKELKDPPLTYLSRKQFLKFSPVSLEAAYSCQNVFAFVLPLSMTKLQKQKHCYQLGN